LKSIYNLKEAIKYWAYTFSDFLFEFDEMSLLVGYVLSIGYNKRKNASLLAHLQLINFKCFSHTYSLLILFCILRYKKIEMLEVTLF